MILFSSVAGSVMRVQSRRVGDRERGSLVEAKEREKEAPLPMTRTREGGRPVRFAAARAVGLVSSVHTMILASTWTTWPASSLGVEPGLDAEKIPPAATVAKKMVGSCQWPVAINKT